MQLAHLSTMQGGWFAGDFSPTALRTSAFEAAVKRYRAGEREAAHHHKAAREITVIVSGRVRMCEREFTAGDVVLLDLCESTSFEALEDTVTVVVKTPSIPGDKYLD
jgi:mannose-6-phosphate isomerase-like protein (cupin superfamily)